MGDSSLIAAGTGGNEKKKPGSESKVATPHAEPVFPVIRVEPKSPHNRDMSHMTRESGQKYEDSRILLEQMSGQVQSGPAILAYLQGTDHLFFKKCKEYPPELNAFKSILQLEIWNSSCRAIYFAGQTWGKCSRFTYHVMDYTGRAVITVKGKQVGPGIKSSATITLGDEDGTILGTISQEFCDASYLIKDKDNKVIYKIQGPCFATCVPCVFWCFEEHFEIDLADGVTEMGLISTHWKATMAEARGTFGLSFPIKMDTNHKALLFGCAFLIKYQYYKILGNGTCMCILYLLVIGAALAICHFVFHLF